MNFDTASTADVAAIVLRAKDCDATVCHRPARAESPVALVALTCQEPLEVEVVLEPRPRRPSSPRPAAPDQPATHRPAGPRHRHRPWAAALRSWSGR